MQASKRRSRAKARAKIMRLRRKGVPCTASKWGWQGTWRGAGLTPGEVQSARKKARFNSTLTVDQFDDDGYFIGSVPATGVVAGFMRRMADL